MIDAVSYEDGQVSKSEFVQRIQEKKLPISDETAAAFEAFHRDRGAPDGFLNRVVDATTYIDEATFNKSLEQMAEKVNTDWAERDYSLLMYGHDKSSSWIYQRLLALGIKPPSSKFAIRSSGVLPSGISDLSVSVPKRPVAVVDDWSISRKQLRDLFDKLPPHKEKHVYLTTLTDHARRILMGFYPNLRITTFLPDLKTLEDALTEDDLKYVSNLERDAIVKHETFYRSEQTLSWSFFRTPDNVPSVFKGGRLKETGEQIPALIPSIYAHYREMDKGQP